MNPNVPLLAGVALALAAPTAKSQFGHLPTAPINVSALTGHACYGVCRTATAAGPRLWVSAAALPGAGNPHLLFEIDPAVPAVVAAYPQPTVYGAGNPIGIRDVTVDAAGILYGGQERAVVNQIHRFDTLAKVWLAGIPIATPVGVGPGVLHALVVLPGGSFLTANGGANVFPINAGGAIGAPIASGFADITGAGFDVAENRVFWFSNGATGMDYDPARTWGVVVADGRYCGGAYRYMSNVTYGDASRPFAGGFLGGRAAGMEVDRLGPGGSLCGLLLQKANNDWVVQVELELNRGATCACGPVCGVPEPAGLEMAGATGFISPSPAFVWELHNAACAAGGVALLGIGPGVGAAGLLPCDYLLAGAPLAMLGPVGIAAGGTAAIPLPIPGGLPFGLPMAFQSFLVTPAFALVTSKAAFLEIR